MAAIEAGTVRTVLTVKLDRLGRSVPDVLAFFDLCERQGVRVVVTTQAIDTGTPTGRLVRTILAGVAEFEGELIRERTRAAMRAIKEGTRKTKSGRPLGRPLKIGPEAVEHARVLRSEGRRWSEIAQTLGLKAESLRRVLYADRKARGAVLNPSAGETGSSAGGDLGPA